MVAIMANRFRWIPVTMANRFGWIPATMDGCHRERRSDKRKVGKKRLFTERGCEKEGRGEGNGRRVVKRFPTEWSHLSFFSPSGITFGRFILVFCHLIYFGMWWWLKRRRRRRRKRSWRRRRRSKGPSGPCLKSKALRQS